MINDAMMAALYGAAYAMRCYDESGRETLLLEAFGRRRDLYNGMYRNLHIRSILESRYIVTI